MIQALEQHPVPARHKREGAPDQYSRMSTLSLLKSIVEDSDQEALRCLLMERNVFRHRGRACLLPEFLVGMREDKLRYESANGGRRDVEERVDHAWLQTFSRFMSLPRPGTSDGEDGIDCRNQFRAVVHRMQSWHQLQSHVAALAEEEMVSRLLQAMVCKHFRYGWLDACRTGPLETRYFLSRAGCTIELRRPVQVDATFFRGWLSARYDDQDLSIPGMRESIQFEVDETFGRPCLQSWNADFETPSQEPAHDAVVEEQTRELLVRLARLVAVEKSASLQKQRPSIRRLGRDKLYQLCYRTICEVVDGEHEAQRLAAEVGLSKAAMSRFAATQWATNGVVPDLWANTAHIMVSDRRFTEGLVEEDVAGVLLRLHELAAGGCHE
ncbi:MAG: hypothetical protein HN559_17490 [Gemmatimonadetes bacterium]|jgi:hypothetical protein|nr:hypothetical protein [Gemmatimonadota bacterium]MBT5141070.1 hypothetical protein [Gemmatimonadota bacterium]MBT5592057.1 hypothetical protein [Gemmatimonadota bacterium]MBT5964639.1 hypothetical protein [Gemmatimonadota bacterium]MBT6630895.1 hypothetical protein [Gemmatimonadota bacterium]